MFISDKNVTERDIKGDENKIKRFLRDIGYKERGDTKSNRPKLISGLSIKIFSPRRDFSSEETVFESDEEVKAIDLSNALGCYTRVDPNNLTERLELIILETKAGHDELYNVKNT